MPDAGFAVGDVDVALADPEMHRQASQGILARRDHQGFPKQDQQRQHHRHGEEGGDPDGGGPDPGAEIDLALPEALAGQRHEALANPDDPAVDPDEGDRHDDQDQGQDEGVAAVAGVQRGVDLGREGKEPDRQTQQGRRSEGAENADEGQHHGGTQRRQQQRKRDPPQPLAPVHAGDGARLLQLRIHRRQGPRHQQVAVGVVVQRQADDDGEEAVAHPVGRLHAEEAGDHAFGAADPVVLEKAQPRQRQHPRRHHVGHHHQGPEHALEADVGAHHQPCEAASDAHAQNGHADADGDAVEQRLQEQRPGKRAGEDPFEVKEGEAADLGLRPVGEVVALVDQGVVDDLEERHQHQEGQHGEAQDAQDLLRLVHHPVDVVAEVARREEGGLASGRGRIQRHVSGLPIRSDQAGGD